MRLLQTANVVIKKMSIPPLVLLVQRLILWHHADGDGADNDYDGTNDADANLNVHNFIDMVHCAFLLAIMRKTTLLTMLQQQWSQHWQSPNQDRFRELMMFLSCSCSMSIAHAHNHAHAHTCVQRWSATVLHACSSDHVCWGESISKGV